MSEAKFKIGDRVLTDCGEGNVTDVYRGKDYAYGVDMESSDETLLFFEEELKLIPEKNGYSMDIKIDIASNVVIATLFEETEDIKSPLAKGHGHIIHEGELGVAQAASYACKKLYESLGGSITKGGSWR